MADIFEQVDPCEHPLTLLSPAFRNDGAALYDESRAIVRGSISSTTFQTYNLAHELHEYEAALNLATGAVARVIEKYREMTGKSALSVLDAGCGNAFALGEIAQLPGVGHDKAVGMTLRHPITHIRQEVEDMVVIQNIARVAPKIRFDVVISVMGASYYHPLNKDLGPKNTQMFGILQLVNFTEVGGLFLVNSENSKETDIETADTLHILLQCSILQRVPEFDEFASKPELKPLAFIVARHPKPEEIKQLLQIGEDGVYSLST